MKKQTLILATAFLVTTQAFARLTPGRSVRNSKQQQNTSIRFTENKGQVHDQYYKSRPDVLYAVMAGNMAVHIKTNGVSYQLYRTDKYKEVEDHRTQLRRQEIAQQTICRIDLSWLNANTSFTKTEDGVLPGYDNYYLENCPDGALNVISYTGFTLHNLYKGIDLHYYGKKGALKHDYIVAPHADYRQIQVQVEGADITVNKDGSLLLSTALGKVEEGAPVVFQNGKQLKARWQVSNNILSFKVENYNPAYALIIDPITRLWGTYYGGTIEDLAYSCVTDANNNVYLGGYTSSTSGANIATVGSHQSTYGGGNYDSYLAKFNTAGVRLWSTYYGGAGYEDASYCATDAFGNVYMSGFTRSSSAIATVGSHQPAFGGGTSADGFLVKFDGNGIRQWGTYYGGTDDDAAYACATDPSGNIYIAGFARSNTGTVIATPGSHQPALFSSYDAFLAKFNSAGVRQWGTFYGGSKDDLGYACSTDASGNVFLGGHTQSTSNVATAAGHQTVYAGGPSSPYDAFLVKFDASGTRQWATYYGGTGNDYGKSCATDASGNVYLVGHTDTNTGTVIATVGSHQPNYSGGGAWITNAYLVKFDANGTRQWGTYYGSGTGAGNSCITDPLGNVYLAGTTTSNLGSVIATAGSHQTTLAAPGYDAFLAKFNANGTRLSGTFYGGADMEYGNSCALDIMGNVYLAGMTTSTATGFAIATSGSHKGFYGGGNWDGFLVKFDACDAAPPLPSAISGPTAICAGLPASYTIPKIFGASAYTWSLPVGWTGGGNSTTLSATPVSSATVAINASNTCGTSPQQTLSVTVYPKPNVLLNGGAICVGQSFTLAASGANTYTFSNGPVITPTLTSLYTVTATSVDGCTNTAANSVIVHALPTVSINSGLICVGQSFTLVASGANTYTYSSGPVVSPGITTSYSVTGTSIAGCVSSNTAVSEVTVSATPIPTITVNSGAICRGSSFTIVPSGASTYTIQGGTSVVSPVNTTSYTVTGTSPAGCISSSAAVSAVTVHALPTLSLSSNNALICAGEEATLSASGASTYTFNTGDVGADVMVTPTITSNYMVTGTDANGCVNTAVITQNVDACTAIKENGIAKTGIKLYPNPAQANITLELDSDHEITILNAIGQTVYSAQLDSGTHQVNLEHLVKGIYVVKAGNVVSLKLVKD